MRRLSIRSRMICVFVVIAMVQAAIAGFGMRGLGLAGQDLSDMYQVRLLPVSGLARINELMHTNIEQLTTAVIARPSPSNVQKYLDRVTAALDEVEVLAQDYTRRIAGDGDRQRLAEWTAKRNDLVVKGIRPAIAAIKAQAFDDAEDILLGVAAKQFASVQQVFDSIVVNELRKAEHTHQAAEERYRLTRAGAIVAVLFAVGLCAMMALYVTRSISAPLTALASAMRRLGEGDLTVTVSASKRNDEVGTIAKSVQAFKDSLIEASAMRQAQATARDRAEQDKRAALTAMADQIESQTGLAARQIGERTQTMTATADGMLALSGRAGQAAQGAVLAAATALGNAQSVAGSAEELAASIREISQQVSQSTVVVNKAVESGRETRATIETLSQRVNQIGAVADIISDIASKTNLLALNATIEAARAGEAGKGFAVVASEVKQLANQTARSTQEITRHIAGVRSATSEAVAAVFRIEATINEVNAIAGSIAAAVEQQGVATAEIARNVTETASAVNEMKSRNVEVAEGAGQVGHHAEEVLENTRGLDGAIGELKRAVILIVRTSTAEVDRRMFRRHANDMSCQIDLAGQSPRTARLIDISEGGARLSGLNDVSAGMRGALRLSGLAVPVAFSILQTNDNETRVVFQTDEAAGHALRAFLDSKSDEASPPSYQRAI